MAKSDKMTVWNYDKAGDLDNPISRALQWTEICDAIAVSDDEDEEKENSGKQIVCYVENYAVLSTTMKYIDFILIFY